MPKFITTNGYVFVTISATNGFSVLEYHLDQDKWFASEKMYGFQALANDEKLGGPDILNTVGLGSVTTHNFF